MKKRKISPFFSLRILFIVMILLGLILIELVAVGITALLSRYVEVATTIPDFAWLFIISVILGTGISAFLLRYFISPISKIGMAMQKVAQGDFDVTLEEKKGFPEIRQIKHDFNIMTKQLRSTEILQTEFVSNVSHEFKTPINAIEGYATLLQDDDQPISLEQKGYIEKILFNTRRLTHLVGNMLLLSKVDNQKIQTNVTTFRLDEQIRQCILSLESRWTKMETEFDAELDSVNYTGTQALLMHVWTNLIENAIKYGPRGGLVRMRLVDRDGVITFTIEDEGPGISKEDQPHIFDRFYQVDSSRKVDGNGLGLALVKQILKQVHGAIFVENRKEGGCRFVVQLRDEE